MAFKGLKYMLFSTFRFLKSAVVDGTSLLRKNESEEEGVVDRQVAPPEIIFRNMKISSAIFGVLFLLCVAGVFFYTKSSAIAGVHFMLLAVFFGYKLVQVSNDILNFPRKK
jgi:hypothetical protein